jgi:transcriptional regulator with AAA-type ATPase domain/predicted negative regulator of RcsB-dependent stress response
MDFAELPRRFSAQGRHVFDHWQDEKLSRITVANTPENLLKVNKIFSFHSNFMQDIIDFRENNFEINIVTQPFRANSSIALPKQTAPQAKSIFRQFLALLRAAQEWDMDFIDFTKFQILPGTTVRFGWDLQGQKFPDPAAFIPVFRKNRHLHFLDKNNYLAAYENSQPTASSPTPRGYLYRNDDFTSNVLHTYSLTGIKSNANLKIRINTKDPLQMRVIQNALFHNLNSEEILFIKIAAENISLSGYFSAFCSGRRPGENDAAILVREFGLFLKQSVFRKTIMLIDGLGRKEDGQFLRFLLESGDISGLTIILFNDTLHFDCDLELNEDPGNPLQKTLLGPYPAQNENELTGKERELLKMLQTISVPIPTAVAHALAGPGSATRIQALLEKRYLQEIRQTLLPSTSGNVPAPTAKENDSQLTLLASKTDWPYLTIRHYIATENLTALEQYLKNHAVIGVENIAPGPASDLIVRHLPQLAKNQKLFAHFLEILIRTNAINLAEKLLAEYADPGNVFTGLQAAHLAMRKKEYQKLGVFLAASGKIPEADNDEWLYLNFFYCEKISEIKKADAFVNKIKAPYYRNLAVLQLSDRKIYKGDYAQAQFQLEGALNYFQARHCCREEIEIQNQMAKLQRERGCFSTAESLYKTIFIKSETEGFRLNSAFTAVDLGNLYLENDNDFQAESWYQKALELFEKEKNCAGITLVNSNLINVLISKGNWKEAESLLRGILAGNEEKKPLVSGAIDYLNWANLEYLRQNNGRALKLIGHASRIFERMDNNKGLAECVALKGKIFFLEGKAIDPRAPGVKWFNRDQKIAWQLCQLRELTAATGKPAAILKQLAAIRSKKIRFAALALLLKKFKIKEWLGVFKELSREMSEKSKNYFYYEYWYLYFDLAADKENITGPAKECFLAMHDFFSMNKRKISPKLDQLRMDLEQNENQGNLFDDARLVENYRQWRLPEDFFGCFSHEINKSLPADWLTMNMYENEALLFKFSNSDHFKELGAEMLHYIHRGPENQNLRLPEIKTKFNSQEKFFYPFANTKMMCWTISDHLVADLVIAFRDGESYFQDFFERNRDVFNKFAVLFRNFFENELQIHEKLHFIIGASEEIKEMKRLIAQISKVDFSLLITGESGSGKELVAHAVHLLSPRANQPFIPVNAAALPETLLEAELFGYKKGAFSGAVENRMGLLEAADRGTFFLDEIADLPLNLQAKMLRVLQEKEIRRLGENKTIKIDIRLISASNKNLKDLILANQFREDLYYRLQDLTIHIPPLRERREDIPLLVAHFLKKFGYPTIDPVKLQGIAELFQNDRFPGNVRELESKIKKLITFNPELDHPVQPEKKKFSLKIARQNFDRSLLLNTLNETQWNKNKTAEKLGVSRMALFNMLKKHNIKK